VNPDTEISFLPLENIWADGRFDPSSTIVYTGDVASYNPVAEGDILVPKVTPTFSHGRVAIARHLVNNAALATSEVFVVRARDNTKTRFLRYRLLAKDFRTEGEASQYGVAGLKRISTQFLRDVRIAEEPWHRASAIADFLDRECERIAEVDSALSDAAALTEEHFDSALRCELFEPTTGVPFGRIATLQRGFDLPDTDRSEGSVPVIGSGGPVGVHDQAVVDGPAVVTGRYGSVGHVEWVNEPCWPLNTTLYVRSFNGNHPRYVYWLLRAMPLRSEAEKAAVPGLHRADAHRLRVRRVAPDAQQNIVEQLDSLSEKTAAIISTVALMQARLAEYRDALITEAVAGQLDVSRTSDAQMDERAYSALEGAAP
jgi:type I restriction enzyme S subunit